MKKFQLKGFAAGVMTCLLTIGIIGTAAATTGKRNVNISYDNIKVTLNGSEVALVDAEGYYVEPFLIDGTTYLPVRAVATALGLDVGWDGATKTVELSSEKQISLNLSFGERSGTYSGSVNENGIPDGIGTFTSKNAAGTTWTYTGMFENGHFSGSGVTTWDGGETLTGTYRSDIPFGACVRSFENGTSFCGQFSDVNNASGVYIDTIGNKYIGVMENGEVTYYK